MGQRGPKPTPTQTLADRGSWVAKTRSDEPKPQRTLPPCPAWVSAEAKKYWKDIGSVLDGMKVMTVADRVALGLLADALARYVAAKGAVYGTAKEPGTGLLTFNGSGTPIKHPMALLMAEAWEQVLKTCREFGLTPSSRTGVRLTPIRGGKDGAPDNQSTKKALFRS
jgi:P27 family predicted phage terminase small subunit